MHHNVIWNAAGGLMVKGDYHNIHNNTVFNSTDGKNDIIILTDTGINNANSTDITANVYKSKKQQTNEQPEYEECLSCQ